MSRITEACGPYESPEQFAPGGVGVSEKEQEQP